jgi:putative glutamine amidotransferase
MRALRIALTVDSRGPGKGYFNYIERIGEHGGEAVVLVPGALDLATALDGIDGLLVPGGTDVDPALYGEAPAPELGTVDAGRDELELTLIREALRRDMPLLAICRGFQALNVACGGRLQQHIPGDTHRALDGGRGESQWHDVTVDEASQLAGLLGAGWLRVNSRHHQAVRRGMVADGLIESAISPDGCIEGLESPSHRFVVAVQWHPERPEIAAESRALFAAFAGATRGALI